MRNHGWELPYHPLQGIECRGFSSFSKALSSAKHKILMTVAVAVFSGISFSFYVFFIPFVGSSVLKFHIYAVFSPVVLAVFILYVRCAGCDPADSGVHQSKRAVRTKEKAAMKAKDLTLSNIDTCYEHSHDEPERRSVSLRFASACGRWLCLPFACCKGDDSAKQNSGEQLLYCSICEAEISRNSKHCRACDKCVHGFDHHCRWLNNCVGKKNYRTFVCLMMACLLLLVIVWTTGIGVLVRCFSEKTSFEKEIIHRLGSSFSRISYIVVVVFLSLLAMLATIPLCQLFFFHLILIHKGITTYDYILAVREQEQGQEQDHGEVDGFNSLTSSPASSTITGVSAGFSSVGASSLHRGVFCTPPRMFVEHQQTVLAFSGDLESNNSSTILTRKPATTTLTTTAAKAAIGAAPPPAPPSHPQKKISVGINPWKLARMNPEEATKAAAQAREASAILQLRATQEQQQQQQLMMYSTKGSGSQIVTETEDSSLDSSRNVSGEITIVGNRRFPRRKHELGYLTGKERWLLMKDRRHGLAKNTRPGILLSANNITVPDSSQLLPRLPEPRSGFRCSPSRFSGGLNSCPGSSYPGSSYPGSQTASPDIHFQDLSPDLRTNTIVLPLKPSLRTDHIVPKPSPDIRSLMSKVLPVQQSRLPAAGEVMRDGYEASAGESGDEKQQLRHSRDNSGHLQGLILCKGKLDTSVVTPSEKVAVWEDGHGSGEEMNGVGVGNSKARRSTGERSLGSRGSRSSRGASSHTTGGSSGSRVEANILKHVRKDWPDLRSDNLSLSPGDDGSTDEASSPTRNNSPARAAQLDIHVDNPIFVLPDNNIDQTRDRLMQPTADHEVEPHQQQALPSTRKLKESLILMAKTKTKKMKKSGGSPSKVPADHETIFTSKS